MRDRRLESVQADKFVRQKSIFQSHIGLFFCELNEIDTLEKYFVCNYVNFTLTFRTLYFSSCVDDSSKLTKLRLNGRASPRKSCFRCVCGLLERFWFLECRQTYCGTKRVSQ